LLVWDYIAQKIHSRILSLTALFLYLYLWISIKYIFMFIVVIFSITRQ
jgi:hypothetical protein